MAETARTHGRSASDRIGPLDIVGDGFYAGSIGAAAVALFFLVSDAIQSTALFTPSLVGSVLLSGATPSRDVPVDLEMVGLFSVFHGAAFVAFGIVCAWILARLDEIPDLPLVALACFVGLEIGAVFLSRLLSPDLASVIGHGLIATANVLAAIGMSVWLTRFARHPGDPE